MERGLVHIYCGDGKGKTTAAVGLCVRMAGSGGKVLFFQFLKSNGSCERLVLKESVNVHLLDGLEKVKFTFHMSDEEKNEARVFYEEKLSEICNLTASGEYDMVVLDEIIGAVEKGIINEMSVIRFLKEKPEQVEVVMTGRNPTSELLSCADYVTEMKKMKHPYDIGIKGRRGVEF